MISTQTRPGRTPHGDATAPRLPSLDVLLGHDGKATLNGEPIPVREDEGETVHDAILNLVQRLAQEQGQPLEVTVLDQREGYVARLQVAPDGSSQLLASEATPAAEPAEPAEPALPPQARAGAGGAPAVPAELRDAVAQINQASTGQDWERATVLALRLAEHAARAYGEEHPYTLEARSLAAHVAHLSGDQLSPSPTFLDVARIRHAQGDPRAREDLRRAVAIWRTEGDPQAVAAHGRALLNLWFEVVDGGSSGEDDGATPADMAVLHQIERRLRAFTARHT